MRLLALVLLLGPLAGTAAAQPAADVTLPSIELSTSLSFDFPRADASSTGTLAGGVLGVHRNLGGHLAVTAEVAGTAHHVTVMAGPRVSTGFYRDGGAIPGRFFLEALAGIEQRPDGRSGAMLVGGGADVLLGPPGISLHWALDYLFRPGDSAQYAGGRFAVGLVLGPHKAH